MKPALLALLLALTGCASAIGDGCSADDDCSDGLCSTDAKFPGGYCTLRCNGGSACPAGAACAVHGAETLCLRSCTDGAECRDGYVCKGFKGQGTFCLASGDD